MGAVANGGHVPQGHQVCRSSTPSASSFSSSGNDAGGTTGRTTNLENPTSMNLPMSRRSPRTPSGTRSRNSVGSAPLRLSRVGPGPRAGTTGGDPTHELLGRVPVGVADAHAEVLGVDAPAGLRRRRPR